ncbi:DUF1579 domain-containing protein [Mucilaginibacter rubeus]|uniref:DUF1579 domain-containing protein n=1 Tax=Mucilaginibacter rubeus TaxID=2027860 RepID=A0AAE6JBQ8_9SPHI|nr:MULTISPECIES: DUF1579 family protein [Mucilaginibacter]QEM02591.1 DUF1579 domain-containing protein [Mucilaginibacter rubeus]QEM15211.1 DUF1579 domain-containing protein [Mucilaginibacter gossypii]QTE42065.1 DUF1579 family protein [Mucilaginibacter rubeus]QTE48666.1 DUF1579 family protein [Mucilaginibacter rubeus]QTE60052.1 DUF1579 family protein [Mucilaginibacter rubeus]
MKTSLLLKSFTACLSFVFVMVLSVASMAQADKQTDTMDKLLDYSRPGQAHAALGKLAGTWSFQDARLAFVKGTLVRKPIYNGRFYSVEMTGGKLPVPVADGQMKEEFYQSIQIEGFDNPKMKYVTTSINNHIGSDIQMQSGNFDSAKQVFTYEWDDELIPGQIQKNRRILTINDASHYTEVFYELRNNEFVKVRELDFTRK